MLSSQNEFSHAGLSFNWLENKVWKDSCKKFFICLMQFLFGFTEMNAIYFASIITIIIIRMAVHIRNCKCNLAHVKKRVISLIILTSSQAVRLVIPLCWVPPEAFVFAFFVYVVVQTTNTKGVSASWLTERIVFVSNWYLGARNSNSVMVKADPCSLHRNLRYPVEEYQMKIESYGIEAIV